MPEPTSTQTAPAPSAPAPSASPEASPAAAAIESKVSPSREQGSDFILDFGTPDAPSPTAAPQQPQRTPRTFRNDEERAIFSQMSNEAYNKLYPLYTEYSDGKYVPKTQLEEIQRQHAEATKSRWYDHPEAYQLTDDHKAMAGEVQTYNEVLQHYANQLQNIANKRPIQMVTQDKDGRYVIDPDKYEGDASAQAAISGEIAMYNARLQSARDKLGQYKTSFTGKFNQIKEALGQVDKNVFGPYDSNPSFKEAVKRELALFPTEIQSMPEYQLLAKASVYIKAMQKWATDNKRTAMNGATHQNTAVGGQIDPSLPGGNAIEQMLASRR